jgi:hypothetical protein
MSDPVSDNNLLPALLYLSMFYLPMWVSLLCFHSFMPHSVAARIMETVPDAKMIMNCDCEVTLGKCRVVQCQDIQSFLRMK